MSNKNLRVLLTTNIPAPYMIDYLDCLGKLCDLTVLFEMRSAKDRKEEWYGTLENKSFKGVFLDAKPVTAESGLSFKITKYLKGDFDRIIIANPTTPTGVVALLYCRMKKIPHILQSEGGFRGTGKGLKERFKKFLMGKAELYLSGMKGNDDYFLSYGATEETLRWYPFTSLKKEQIDKQIIFEEERINIRKELNITEERVIVSVGSVIPRKGFDILLKAKANLNNNVGLYIIGGEASLECLQIIEEKELTNVHFIKHCDFFMLRKYYHAADIFTLLTREDTWGLVINEAMASGLPIITTDRCVAGKQLIIDGVNGYIIPTDDVETVTVRINELLSNEELRNEMAQNNLNKISEYYIENMAQVIFNHINNKQCDTKN